MNKPNNKKYYMTESKIENALMDLLKYKTFDSIYVNDICKKAGIARTSFYSHYDDINDLICKIQEKYYKDIINMLVTDHLSLKDAFTKYFYYLKDHSDFYKAYLISHESRIFKKQHYESLYNLYSKLPQNKNKTERIVKYNMVFLGAGIKSIAYKWLNDGCIETPEEMAELLYYELNLNN